MPFPSPEKNWLDIPALSHDQLSIICRYFLLWLYEKHHTTMWRPASLSPLINQRFSYFSFDLIEIRWAKYKYPFLQVSQATFAVTIDLACRSRRFRRATFPYFLLKPSVILWLVGRSWGCDHRKSVILQHLASCRWISLATNSTQKSFGIRGRSKGGQEGHGPQTVTIPIASKNS